MKEISVKQLFKKFYHPYFVCEWSYSICTPQTRINTGKTKDRRFKIVGLSMVRVTGLEPARLSAQDPKSCTSANSAIPATFAKKSYHKGAGNVNCLRSILMCAPMDCTVYWVACGTNCVVIVSP
jgi:hypothetical protein